MQIAVGSLGRARGGLRWTIDYVRERSAFGKPIGALQNTRFALADVATEVSVAEAFIDRCVVELNAGRLSAADAAKAKLWATEMEFRCLDSCQQLFGGYGYMREYPIARSAVDARVTRVYGGTSHHARDHRPGPESRAVTVKDNDMHVCTHSLGDIPRRSARRYPDKVAVIDGDLTLTFAKFD